MESIFKFAGALIVVAGSVLSIAWITFLPALGSLWLLGWLK